MKIAGKLVIRSFTDNGINGVLKIDGLASNPITDINFSEDDLPKLKKLVDGFQKEIDAGRAKAAKDEKVYEGKQNVLPLEADVLIEIPEPKNGKK